MSWTFSQTSGLFSNPPLTNLVGRGYSGGGPGKNNPALQAVHNVGPIPQGLWHGTELLMETLQHGSYVIVLVPDAATQTFGRTGFMLHGDSFLHPGAASEGCIIQGLATRTAFWISDDHDIMVTA